MSSNADIMLMLRKVYEIIIGSAERKKGIVEKCFGNNVGPLAHNPYTTERITR